MIYSHDPSEYDSVEIFRAKFNGFCFFDDEHKIRRNDLIFKPRKISHPGLVVGGYGCKNCLKLLGE